MQGRKNYQEKLFTTFRLSDRVPENNFYRRLDKELDLRFLYKATEKYYGKEGQTSIDPVVFFKLLLTGYFENIHSDRRIIENAKLRLDILYFIGYDIDEELPWHSTLSRTRQLYGEEVFRNFFQQVLKMCIDKGMVAGRRQAVDSVFVKANASMQSVVDKEILKDGDDFITSLDKSAKEEVPVKKITTGAKKRSNKNRGSTTDPDARISKKPGKPRRLNYLGQVSVDTSHHVITNIEAHHADKRDSECLEDIIDHTIENLSTGRLKVKEILADTNYSSIDALSAIHKKNLIAYIPNVGTYKPHRSGFIYLEEEDCYECGQGAKLLFRGIKKELGRSDMKQYSTSAKDCKGCPIKEKCIGKGRYKKLSHSLHRALFDEVHERMQGRFAWKMKKLRHSTVEPVIGSLVNSMAMAKVNTRGLKQADKCMISAAIAYNLKKCMKWSARKRGAVAIAMYNAGEKLCPQQYLNHVKQNWTFIRAILCQNRPLTEVWHCIT